MQLYRKQVAMQCKEQTVLLHCGILQEFLLTGCFQVEKQILTWFLELKENLTLLMLILSYVMHQHPPWTVGAQYSSGIGV